MIFTEEHQVVMALAPDADRYNGDPATDIVNMENYGHVTFVILEGAGGVGTAAITVEECTDAAGTGATAIAFRYRTCTSGDTWGSLTTATASGVTPAAGANKMIAVEIDARELSDGSNWVRLQLTEDADAAVDAAVIAILSKPRYAGDSLLTAIA